MTDDETIRGWLTGRLPADWFDAAPEVTVDREEILVVGAVAPPALAEGASEAEQAAAVAGRVREFRERTRDQRMRIAQELQQLAGRTVSWGVTVDGQRELFTTASVPVMTRLRQPERQVLDTLVDAGVARSRSDALAWCVRLVGRNADAWLADLRTAMEEVGRVRAAGPS
jgi:hypothetical protein